jgi:hypothetical protein
VGGQSEAELILCLEGDNKQAHFKTVMDMLDANMSFIRMYQFMMLPGTKSSSKVTREKHGFVNRYRVLPRCFGNYTIYGETVPVAEIEEIVIANNTMPYEDYQACRDLHLTVEIFHNDSIFNDLVKFLLLNGISRTDFIAEVHKKIVDGDNAITKLYSQFREEEIKNLSENISELEEFIKEPDVIDKYIDGEYGTNELYKYRAISIFNNIEILHNITYEVAESLLAEKKLLSEDVIKYLNELFEFSMMRKCDLLDTEQLHEQMFHFDFVKLIESNFSIDPFEVIRPEGVKIQLYHSKEQIKLIQNYKVQYGFDLIGLGRILLRANMNRLYRSVWYDDGQLSMFPDQDRTNKRSNLQLIA